MVRRLVLAALALIAVGVMSTAQAQKGDKWVLMGAREVDLAKGNDSIDVSKAKGSIKAIRLESKDGAILLSRVQVVYHNGTLHNEDRRINLLDDERTRPIDLRNNERFADAVNLGFRAQIGHQGLARGLGPAEPEWRECTAWCSERRGSGQGDATVGGQCRRSSEQCHRRSGHDQCQDHREAG